jgi:hypothetical protein
MKLYVINPGGRQAKDVGNVLVASHRTIHCAIKNVIDYVVILILLLLKNLQIVLHIVISTVPSLTGCPCIKECFPAYEACLHQCFGKNFTGVYNPCFCNGIAQDPNTYICMTNILNPVGSTYAECGIKCFPFV